MAAPRARVYSDHRESRRDQTTGRARGGEPRRPAPQAVARAAPDEPARPRGGSRDLDAPPELPRDRARPAEPGDAAAPGPGAGAAAARPQRAPDRRGVRADLPGDPARRAPDGAGAAGPGLHAPPAGALPRAGARPPLEHPADQRGDRPGHGLLPRPGGHRGG